MGKRPKFSVAGRTGAHALERRALRDGLLAVTRDLGGDPQFLGAIVMVHRGSALATYGLLPTESSGASE
jgi:hypothetical protein